MIFPWPKFSISRLDFNFTNVLMVLNFTIFIVFFSQSEEEKVKSYLFNQQGIEQTSMYFYDFLSVQKNDSYYDQLLLNYDFNNKKHQYYLTSSALRDKKFIEYIQTKTIDTDKIRWGFWKNLVDKYFEDIQKQILYIMGLSHGNKDTLSWITYQFSHMNFWHLLSNMIFVFLLGYKIESMLGVFGFILLYLCSGIVGGYFYLYFSPHTLLPMVGASGSVSGLIAFYCFFESKSRSRFFYFLSPQKGQFGVIYLPTLLIIPMFLISDISSFIGQIPGLSGGVAFTAHIGGALFGGLLGIILKSLKFPQNISSNKGIG